MQTILEKLVSAQGTEFVASRLSTFSMDIIEMRKRLGTWTKKNLTLCSNEKAWEWDHTGRPKWMIRQLRVHRWKKRFMAAEGLTREQRKRRERVVTIMNWIDLRARKKSGEELPRWLINDSVWHAWKQDSTMEEGISLEERELRKFLLRYYTRLEDKIQSNISRAQYRFLNLSGRS